jgi:hypothetical protein
MPKAMTKELPSSRSINVHLGAALKAQWSAYCSQLGKTPGAALKEAIEKQLQKVQGKPTPAPYRQIDEAPDDGPKVRVEILLTPSEKAAVAARAEVERCSQRRWIVDAVRVGLTHEPQFSMDEINALGESNYQLLAIGRSLNQIAKRLHEGDKDKPTLAHIESLRRIIARHTTLVSKAMGASLERWRIE